MGGGRVVEILSVVDGKAELTEIAGVPPEIIIVFAAKDVIVAAKAEDLVLALLAVEVVKPIVALDLVVAFPAPGVVRLVVFVGIPAQHNLIVAIGTDYRRALRIGFLDARVALVPIFIRYRILTSHD